MKDTTKKLNCNPIEDGVFHWKDIEVHISEGLGEITLKQGDNQIIIKGGGCFFADVCNVLERAWRECEDEDKQSVMIYNCISTSRSLPFVKF